MSSSVHETQSAKHAICLPFSALRENRILVRIALHVDRARVDNVGTGSGHRESLVHEVRIPHPDA